MRTVGLPVAKVKEMVGEYSGLRDIALCDSSVLKEDLRAFGQLTPIVIQKHPDGSYEMISGWLRLYNTPWDLIVCNIYEDYETCVLG